MHIRLLLLLSLCSMSALGMEEKQREQAKFYVEKPADEYWNVGHGNVVIEAIEEEYKYGRHLVILSPDHVKRSWPALHPDLFIQCNGPSRTLSLKEYVRLIHELMPERPLPRGLPDGWLDSD